MAGEGGQGGDPDRALGLLRDVGAERDAQQGGGRAHPARRTRRVGVVEAYRERLDRRLREVDREARAPRDAATGRCSRSVGGGEADAGEVGGERVERDAAHGGGCRTEQSERNDAARAGQLCEAAATACGCEIGDHRATRTRVIRRETSAGLGTNFTARRERPSPRSSVP